MSFRLVPNSVTLNGLERRNSLQLRVNQHMIYLVIYIVRPRDETTPPSEA